MGYFSRLAWHCCRLKYEAWSLTYHQLHGRQTDVTPSASLDM
ncbi:hypothetical protein V6Z11_A05G122700 [Gossypium hirsutum]